jgi:hypothetical protein
MLYDRADISFLKDRLREKNILKGAGKDAKLAKDSSHG